MANAVGYVDIGALPQKSFNHSACGAHQPIEATLLPFPTSYPT